jgi:hypothetical protein
MNCIAWLAVAGNSSFLRLAVIASTFMSAIPARPQRCLQYTGVLL